MSHCAPEGTLKPIRFQFISKTIIGNVFVMQAVPNMSLSFIFGARNFHSRHTW